jgi:hypothetical protein
MNAPVAVGDLLAGKYRVDKVLGVGGGASLGNAQQCASTLGSMTCGCTYLTTCCQALPQGQLRTQCLSTSQQGNPANCGQAAARFCISMQ